MQKLRKYTHEEALHRLAAWCARGERCHQDVTKKLYSWGFHPSETDDIFTTLLEKDFVNEERYAKAFVHDKLLLQHWGRKKITQELKQKGIYHTLIQRALKIIVAEEYQEVCNQLAAKKWEQVLESNTFKKQQKIMQFLLRRGFEYEVARKAVLPLE